MAGGEESGLGLLQSEEGAGMPGRREDQLLPAMLACLSSALHCKNKWKQHTPDRKKREEKKSPKPPHRAPLAGLGQGPGLGYLLLFFPGKLLVPHLHLPQTETTQCHNPSPVTLSSLPPPTSDTHTLTQNDGSLDSLNEQSPGSAS